MYRWIRDIYQEITVIPRMAFKTTQKALPEAHLEDLAYLKRCNAVRWPALPYRIPVGGPGHYQSGENGDGE